VTILSIVQPRSAIALGTFLLSLALLYFGRFLPDGSAGLNSDHPHTRVVCETCHTLGVRPDSAKSIALISETCKGCHEEIGTASPLFHSGSRPENCTNCHSFHRPELVIVKEDTLSLRFASEAKAICLDCHANANVTPQVGDGHLVAARLAHSQRSNSMSESPSEFCLTCHGTGRAESDDEVGMVSAPRFHVNASHVYGQEVTPGLRKSGSMLKIQDEIPPYIVVVDGKIECQSCHTLISKNDYLLCVTIEGGLCESCHDMNGGFDQPSIFTAKP
jgi:hypothetical protein